MSLSFRLTSTTRSESESLQLVIQSGSFNQTPGLYMVRLVLVVLFLYAVSAAVKSDPSIGRPRSPRPVTKLDVQQFCNSSTISVDLSQYNLVFFPELKKCAAVLTHLDLSNNQISLVPAEIDSFVNLEVLILDNNMIPELPAEIGNLTNLRVLWVNNNKLKFLPGSIGQLQKLRELQVNRNNLLALPAQISSLQKLEELSVADNSLTHLGTELGMLTNLRVLSVSNNRLKEIPAEVGSLHALLLLLVDDNELSCLPRSVKRLPALNSSCLPVCRSHSVEGYLTFRTAEKGTCQGIASSINGTALGCFDYVHTSCSMTATEVMVTTRRLSDLSSAGLSCAPGAPQLGVAEVAVYPRCDQSTGRAFSCGSRNTHNSVNRRAGLTTLQFYDRQACSTFASNVAPTRRLSASSQDPATGSIDAPSAPGLHLATHGLSIHTAAVEAARAADLQAKKAEIAAARRTDLQLNAGGAACNATTAFVMLSDAQADLTPCRASLAVLVVYDVDFSAVLPQILMLSNLRVLRVFFTRNTRLPEDLSRLTHLTTLEIFGTDLVRWPAVLQRMPQLMHLTLSGAGLSALPLWLGKLRNLVHLDVSHNSMLEIGDEIGNLVNLESLVASYAQVRRLSPAIDRLTRLRALDLRWSYGVHLPASLATLLRLQSLLLDDSLISCVPDAVRAMPVLAAQHYFDNTPSCEAISRPVAYAQVRNGACLWSASDGLWYKAACDGAKNKLFVTMYADAGCTHQAKRKAAHKLQDFAPVGQCTGHYGFNGTMTVSYTYCHN